MFTNISKCDQRITIRIMSTDFALVFDRGAHLIPSTWFTDTVK